MKVYHSHQPLADVEVSPALLSGSVGECWRGEPLAPGGYRWSFALSGEVLWFSAEVQCGRPHFVVDHPHGAFVEGLWEQDLAEFFIKDSSGRYQEFNFSPAGAWWSCVFSSYRQRADEPVRVRPVSISTRVTDGGWGILCGVALSDLSVSFGPLTAVHVSAITTIDGVRRFVSSARVVGSAPDFHHPQCFSGIEIVG